MVIQWAAGPDGKTLSTFPSFLSSFLPSVHQRWATIRKREPVCLGLLPTYIWIWMAEGLFWISFVICKNGTNKYLQEKNKRKNRSLINIWKHIIVLYLFFSFFSFLFSLFSFFLFIFWPWEFMKSKIMKCCYLDITSRSLS